MDTKNVNKPESQGYDRRSERRARVKARRIERASRPGAAWVPGLILIGLGVMFMLQNFYNLSQQNWWGLIFLVPAVGAFANAWQNFRNTERLTAEGRGALLGGFILVLLAAIVVFELDWSIFIPILFILTGLGMLINRTVLE